MNRRHMLQAMLSVPIAGALGGCRHEHTDHHHFPPSRGGTLRVILQGPFAVVIDTKNHYRITAFVPYTDDRNDPSNDHEFRYAAPINPDNTNVFPERGAKRERNHYQFVLEGNNLETNERMPYIDVGLADFTLKVSGWLPSEKDYFVKLELPAPELITYRNEPVQLGLTVDQRLVVLRTSHVLQYRVRDFDDLKKVTVRSSQLGERHPFSCADLGSVVRQHGATVGKLDPERSQRMATEFDQCSNEPVSALFFGVGLPPSEHGNPGLPDHGRDFFNNKLLGAFPNAVDKEKFRLSDANVQVCGSGGRGNPMFVAAVQRYSMPQPRLVPVTSLTDCRASGLSAINH